MTQRIRHARISALALSALASVACASSPGAPAAAPGAASDASQAAAPTDRAQGAPAAAGEGAAKAADFPSLAAREALTGLTKSTVATPDGQFVAEVEAAGKPTLAKDGDLFVLTIPIGSKQPISCDIYKERIDNGGSISRMLADIGAKVKITSEKVTDVVALGGAPVILVAAEYKVPPKEKDGAERAGQFKLALRSADAHSFLCTHNDIGYHKTFAQVVKGLAASVKPAKKDGALYAQVDALSSQGAPVGFRELRVTEDPRGGRVQSTFETLVLAKGPAELTGHELTSKVLVDKAGSVVGGSFVKTENGELATQVMLKRAGAKEYAFEGKNQGAPLKGSFKVQKDITTDLSRLPALKKFLAGREAEMAFVGYAPAFDATAPREETYKKSSDGLTVAVGASNLKVKLDAAGQPSKAEEPGPAGALLTVERLETRGAL